VVDARKKDMSRIEIIVSVLMIVALLVIIMLYAMDKLTLNGFFDAVAGLIMFCLLLGRMSRPRKNSN
jgi:hypothetical protein